MTENQRQQALTLCDRILETAAKLQAELQMASDVIEQEIESAGEGAPQWLAKPQ
jgi:hypothetical protein